MQKYKEVVIRRPRPLAAIRETLAHFPVCALLGPRQCGKTTLAREIAGSRRASHIIDLETAEGRARMRRPELTLGRLRGLVVIDEIQQMPELFAVLRPLVDRKTPRTKFLVLGSASPDVVRGSSESLAGRVGFVDLGGFSLDEIGASAWRSLWLRGGFPRSFLARGATASIRWREEFVRTFLERDLPQLGVRIPSETLRRFWMMVAHYHGQIWNGAELARALGVSEHTVRGYLDLLSGAYVLRQLQPWMENLAKRQVRSPKVYVRDSGLLHALLGIEEMSDLEAHPKFGASWEGFAIEQILAALPRAPAYFWGTHAGAELDLVLGRGRRRVGVEVKASDAPGMTKSLHVALADLALDRVLVIYPGRARWPIHERVEVVPLDAALADLGERFG
jgi:uncharacterized protein